jgi:predicted transcriptional regulator
MKIEKKWINLTYEKKNSKLKPVVNYKLPIAYF